MRGPDGPTDLDQLSTATRYQLLFFLRTNRFLGMAIFTLLISGLQLGLDLYNGAATERATSASMSSFLANAIAFDSIIIGLTAAIFGGDAISSDMGSATGYFALVLPVRRSVLLLGRYLAAFLVALAILLVYFGFATLGSLYVYGAVASGAGVALGLLVLLTLGTLALAFFLSSLFRRPAISTIATILLLILGFPIITFVVTELNIEPFFMLDYASSAVAGALTPSAHEGTMTLRGAMNRTLTIHTFSPYPWEGAVIMIAYALVFVAVSILIYQYKEVKG